MITKEHPAVLDCIAAEFHVPIGNVLNIYELKLLALRTNALVPTFLSVLAEKHVKMVLWKERLNHDGCLDFEYEDKHYRRAQYSRLYV